MTRFIKIKTKCFIALVLFSAILVSYDLYGATITSSATGTWAATAWPQTNRSGTITSSTGSTTVTGVGTSFTTDLTIGNILQTQAGTAIGTIASITNNTTLVLSSNASNSVTGETYRSQGVGSGDDVIIASGHVVTLGANGACNSIVINSAAATTTLAIVSYTLTVNNSTGSVTINAPSAAFTGSITISTGTLNCGEITIGGGGTANWIGKLAYSGAGTVNCTGVTFTGTAAQAQLAMAANSFLKIGTGTLGTGGTFTCSTGTVEFTTLTGGQTINSYTYYKLLLDNTSGTNTAAGDITTAASGTFTTTAGGSLEMGTYALGLVSIVHNGTLYTQNASATPFTASKTWGGTGTVVYNGTDQTIVSGTYTTINITAANSGTKTLPGSTIGGNFVMSGSVSATSVASFGVTGNFTLSGTSSFTTGATMTVSGNLTIGDGTTFTAAGYVLTINGTTNVGNGTSGTFVSNSSTSSKTFKGLVSIYSGATWTDSGNAQMNFEGGIYSIPTFTAGTGIHTFQTNNQDLTGTFSIPKTSVVTITLTNNGTLTVPTQLYNTGTLNQGINATINLEGTFGITGFTATADGNTVNYSGGTQSPLATTYHHLTISGTSTKTIAGNITVNGNLIINDGTALTMGAFTTIVTGTTQIGEGASGTLNITSTTGTKTFTGLVTINSGGTWNNSANEAITIGGGITNNGTFTGGTGLYTFSTNNQTITGVSSIASATITTIALTAASNFTVTGTLTVNGTLIPASDVIISGGTITGTGTVKVTRTAATADFSTQYTTTTKTLTNLTVEYSGSAAQTVSAITYAGNLTVNNASGVTLAGNVIVTKIVTLTNGELIIGSNTLTLNGTMASTGTGTITGSSSSLLTIGGTGAFGTLRLTQTSASTRSFSTFTMNRTSSGTVTLGSAMDIVGGANTYVMTAGLLIIGSNNLTLGASTTISGTPSTTNMVVAVGTGYLLKNWDVTGSTFVFPVGDNTGTNEYSPVGINITHVSAPLIGIRVTNDVHSQINAVTYIKRYWTVSNSGGVITNWNLTNATGQGLTYLTADIVGTEASLSPYLWDGSSWQSLSGAAVNTTNNYLYTTSTTTPSLANGSILSGFLQQSLVYYWIGGTTTTNITTDGAWSTTLGGISAGSITPTSAMTFIFDGSDISSDVGLQTGTINVNMTASTAMGQMKLLNSATVILTGTSSYTLTANNSAGLSIESGSELTLSTNANLTLAATANATIGGTLTINASRTFTINAASVVTVTGTISKAGSISGDATTTLLFNAGSTYVHNLNTNTFPTAAWNAASTVQVSAVTSLTSAATLTGQTVGNLVWNSSGQTSQFVFNATFTIGGDFYVTNTGTGSVLLSNSTSVSYILTVNGNMYVDGGKYYNRTGTTTSYYSRLTLNGNLTISSGTFDMQNSSSGVSYVNLNGDFSQTGGTFVTTTASGFSTLFMFDKDGTQYFSQSGGTFSPNDVTFYSQTGATLILLTDFVMSTSDTYYSVSSGGYFNANGFTVSGPGTFSVASGGTIQIKNDDGITSAGTAAGDILTTSRSYNGGGIYEYAGTAAQVTGTGLPLTVTGTLKINNTSGVTLSRSTTVTTLTLTDGILTTTSSELLTLANTSPKTITITNLAHVSGPVARITNAIAEWEFPVGKSGRAMKVGITPQQTTANTWTVEAYATSPEPVAPRDNLSSGVGEVSNDEYWDITSAAGSGAAASNSKVKLYWSSTASNVDASDLTNLLIAHYDDGSWASKGRATSSGTNSSGYVESYSSKDFCIHCIGFLSPTALPVRLVSFEGVKYDYGNELNWVTASELNSDYFTIEKSIDGEDFEIIGFKNASGNSFNFNQYTFTDYNVEGAINYYRLKQTDIDGEFEYSPVISIDNRITLIKEKVLIRITNTWGQEINSDYQGVVIYIYSDGTIEKKYNY